MPHAATTSPPPPTDATVGALRSALLILGRRIRNHQTDGATLSAPALSTLARIRREGPQGVVALAEAEHMRPPSMSAIVDRLADAGYVERRKHPRDGRRCEIVLTDDGERFLAETRALRNRWLHRQLAGLSDEDRRLIADAIPALQRMAELP